MGCESEGKEKNKMKCHVCGAKLNRHTTDLPLKLQEGSIVIIRAVPVLQCGNCPEYLLEDSVMAHIDELIKAVRKGAELEILRYAA